MEAVSLSCLPTTYQRYGGSEGLHFVRSHSTRALTKSQARRPRRLVVSFGSQGQGSGNSEEKVPSWAKTDSDEPPPWARDEGGGSSNGGSPQQDFQIPFFVYLLASTVTAIAAIGSVFEYVNKKPVFGVLSSDSIFYTPLLGFFAITGIPTSAFLWFKSVQAANKEAEEQDRRDGFR
ncbi:PREDICTED: uncharacterized protein LOC104808852 [Tarenaya hassleriana]|uniref:uncharacterized protein LOC104808852 n=1 Tax=Tarenaya hassleriana TaxID=28532 RepID=UPI00053C0C5D|nr:PREDICTED: uncharacterized protein LOC104808852 [Tarenaya hassleriana]